MESWIMKRFCSISLNTFSGRGRKRGEGEEEKKVKKGDFCVFG